MKEKISSGNISEEEAAAKEMLCAIYAPKCITKGCPLAKYLCFDASGLPELYAQSNPAARRNIKAILKQAIKEGINNEYSAEKESTANDA